MNVVGVTVVKQDDLQVLGTVTVNVTVSFPSASQLPQNTMSAQRKYASHDYKCASCMCDYKYASCDYKYAPRDYKCAPRMHHMTISMHHVTISMHHVTISMHHVCIT